MVNAGAILAGGILGLSLRRGPSARQQHWLRVALAAVAVVLGFSLAWQSLRGSPGRMALQAAVALLALVLGNLIGRALALQRELNRLGRYAGEHMNRARRGGPDFSAGFVTGTIVFCASPLALLGAFREGLEADPRPLLLKAAIDGLSMLGLARMFGFGSLLSALPVLALQGSLTLLAGATRPLLEHPAALHGFNSVCGLLIAMTSLVILDVRKVPLANYLPALALAPVLRLWLPSP